MSTKTQLTSNCRAAQEKPPPRRASKPAARAPHQTRRCILIDCESESQQRELFEHLTKRGAPCRLLTL